MKCLYCQADLKTGMTAYTINRRGWHVVIDDIAAYICTQCGEAMLDESAVKVIQEIVARIDKDVERLQRAVA